MSCRSGCRQLKPAIQLMNNKKLMNQFDKNQIIAFDVNSKESIKEALKEYARILNAGKAFVNSVFDVEFRATTATSPRRLQLTDVKDTTLLQEALNMGPEGGYFSGEIEDESNVYMSEPLFFALALQEEDLLDEVVTTVKAMVAEIRRLNNTDSIWLDEMRLFGFESIYMLAATHPKYAYLLGQAFIPYWDLEHAVGYEKYLYRLVIKFGWTRDLIKAYIWCDNRYFRYYMVFPNEEYDENWNIVEYDYSHDLKVYFEENNAEYDWFKEAVLERFKEEPVLLYAYSNRAEEAHPILDLFDTLIEDNSGDYREEMEEELLESPFIYGTFGSEAYGLEEYVIKHVDGPLTKYDERSQERIELQEFAERDSYKGDATDDLKEFILALPMGDKIWSYIESGESPSILEEVTEIPILAIAKEHARNFYLRMRYHLNDFEGESSINEYLDTIFSGLIFDLLVDENEEEQVSVSGFISTVSVRADEATEELKRDNQQMFLRVLDVFYRLLNVKVLDRDLEEIIVSEEGYALLTEEEFHERYDKRGAKGVKKPKRLKATTFGRLRDVADSDTLNYIEKVLAQNGREAYDCSTWSKDRVESQTLAAYLLSKDRENMCFDEYTTKLLEFIKEGPWEAAYKQLREHLDKKLLSKEELELIKDYFVNQAVPKATQEDIIQLLEKALYREECYRGPYTFNLYSERQKSYALFRFDGSFLQFVLCSFWMRNLMPPISTHADRIFKLLVSLAPQKVIKLIGKLFSDDYSVVEFEDNTAEEKFYKSLERAKVPNKHIYAFQMVQAQDRHRITEPCNVKEYLSWLDLYDDIDSEGGMIGGYRKKRALAFKEGLDYIAEAVRIQYYIDLQLRHPRFTFEEYDHLYRAFLVFIKMNAKDRDNLQADMLLEELKKYLEGSTSYDTIKELFDNQLAKNNLSVEAPSRFQYSIGLFFWLLDEDMQDRLMTLMINHSFECIAIFEEHAYDDYLRGLVQKEELSIEEYLNFSPEMDDELLDGCKEHGYKKLISRINSLDINRDNWIKFLINNLESPLYKEELLRIIRDGELVNILPKSSPSERIKLIKLIKPEDDADALLRYFANEESRKVQSYLK